MLIIGDVHGKLFQYFNLTKYENKSICVGDFGFKREWDSITEFSHKINMGNHDYIPYVNSLPSLGNWSYTDEIFTVRGADSIDKHLRIEGYDWFSNEELSYPEQLEAFDNYCVIKPNVVVSHDCPQQVMERFFGYPEKSSTRNLLQAMFEFHQPDIWLFGHHHRSKNEILNGCRFICLEELETFKV